MLMWKIIYVLKENKEQYSHNPKMNKNLLNRTKMHLKEEINKLNKSNVGHYFPPIGYDFMWHAKERAAPS